MLAAHGQRLRPAHRRRSARLHPGGAGGPALDRRAEVRRSDRNARLSQTNTRLPAANPSGKLLSTELRTPTDRATPWASGVDKSRTPKNRASCRAKAYFSDRI